MAHKANPATRHVTSINDLSDKDIDTIFELAQSYLNELPDPHFPYRIGRSIKAARAGLRLSALKADRITEMAIVTANC